MTDEQIINALECCATDDGDDCFQCPYCNLFFEPGNGGCVNRCRKDALDLINRQKAEIERLKRGVTFTITIEDFESIKETVISRLDNKIKSEAIKEFAERLKEAGTKVEGGKGFEGIFVMANNLQIDNLVKEMTEEVE